MLVGGPHFENPALRYPRGSNCRKQPPPQWLTRLEVFKLGCLQEEGPRPLRRGLSQPPVLMPLREGQARHIAGSSSAGRNCRLSCSYRKALGATRMKKPCWGEDAHRNHKLTGSPQEAPRKPKGRGKSLLPSTSEALFSAPHWHSLTGTRWQSRNVCGLQGPTFTTKPSVINEWVWG